jgi:hypothetical protein
MIFFSRLGENRYRLTLAEGENLEKNSLHGLATGVGR